MGAVSLEDIIVTPLAKIQVDGGNVLHGLKKSDDRFFGFGEAYFSSIDSGAVKAWKLHSTMIMNLIVPFGAVRFVFCLDNEKESNFRIEEIGEDNYSRLTVPAGIWFGFIGVANPKSLILNIANIEHDKNEVKQKEISTILFNWNS
jgi:dTDP-4-dehydrorhamnose 3,5-epimerase